jgi:hypothetical protein
MAFGGNGIMSSVLHVSLLFPDMRSLVLGLLPCGTMVSGFVLTVIQLSVDAGAPLWAMFTGYACIITFFIVFALIFQPLRPFTMGDIVKRDEDGWLVKTPKRKYKEVDKVPDTIVQTTDLEKKADTPLQNVETEAPVTNEVVLNVMAPVVVTEGDLSVVNTLPQGTTPPRTESTDPVISPTPRQGEIETAPLAPISSDQQSDQGISDVVARQAQTETTESHGMQVEGDIQMVGEGQPQQDQVQTDPEPKGMIVQSPYVDAQPQPDPKPESENPQSVAAPQNDTPVVPSSVEVSPAPVPAPKKKPPSVLRNMITIDFWIMTIFICCNSIVYSWYNGTLFSQFALMGDTTHVWSSSFTYCLLAVLVIFPLYGIIVKAFGALGGMILSNTIGILLLTVISIPYTFSRLDSHFSS